MREVSDHDLTLSQLKTLSLLSELPPEPLSLKDVAERLGISFPAASRAVDPLVRRGLVDRREEGGPQDQAGQHDRRGRRPHPAPDGGAGRGARGARSGFSVTERRKLGDALDEIMARPEIDHYCPKKGARR